MQIKSVFSGLLVTHFFIAPSSIASSNIESKITLLYPYGSATAIPNADQLSENALNKLKKVFAKAQEASQVLMYSFNIKTESRGTPEVYKGSAMGSGQFSSQFSGSMEILAGCLFLAEIRKKNSATHLVTHDLHYECPIIDDRTQGWNYCNSWKRNKLSGSNLFSPGNVRSNDVIIYIIGDNSPTQDPCHSAVMLDAEWHAWRIKSLKEQCKSIIVLIAKEKYRELGNTLMRECKPTNFDEKKDTMQTSASIKNRNKYIFIGAASFVMLIGGLIYIFAQKPLKIF